MALMFIIAHSFKPNLILLVSIEAMFKQIK